MCVCLVSHSKVITRNLGDRNYEKRKQAAMELEHLVKELHTGTGAAGGGGAAASAGNNATGAQQTRGPSAGNVEKIKGIIAVLVNDYAFSTQGSTSI